MLNNVFNQTITTLEPLSLALALAASVILGLLIALTHKYTSTYSKSFLITVSILPLIVQTIIILVNGNLGMGIVVGGTFSLVRFRSLPGTSKEILTVFFAMTVGLATGMGFLIYALIITIIGCLAIILYSKVPLYERNKNEKHLKITIPEDLDYTHIFDETLEKYTKNYVLETVKTTALGSMFELRYKVVLKNDANEKEFMDELRIKNGNLKIIITQPTDYTEL